MEASFIQDVVELMPNDAPTSPVCKKCHLHVFRRKGDICYRCYQEHCAVRKSVLFRQLVTLGRCCLCSQGVPANYRETDIGAVCLACFGRHETIFKWSYDEKRRNNRPSQQNKKTGNRCNKCRKNFEDKLNMTLCQGCFTKKYANAPINGDDDTQPPVLEKMDKKTRRAPKKKTSEPKKERPYQRPASKVAAQMNTSAVAPTMDQVPAPAPELPTAANDFILQNNYQPAVDNSYNWYSQQPALQQPPEEQPAPIPPTANEIPVQYYPEQAYSTNMYQNGYNGYEGYNGYNGYNEYNQYNGYQAEYQQYLPTHPSWSQEYVADQNYGNYDANYQ